jgi:hypothetical protein
VVFSSQPDLKANSFGGYSLSDSMSKAESYRIKLNDSFYVSMEQVGKDIVQLSVDKTNGGFVEARKVHEKISLSISSAFDLVADSINDFQDSSAGSALSVVLPIIVVPNNSIWVVDYDASGNITKEPFLLDSCELFLKKSVFAGNLPGVDYTYSHVHILTYEALGGFLIEINNPESGFWDKLFPIKLIASMIEADNL